MNRFRKYLTLMKIGILDTFQFRIGLFVMVLGNILYLILIYFLWKAIFASAGTDVVSGMTFESTMIYLVLATALNTFIDIYTVWTVGRAVRNGNIVLDLLRPFEYKNYLFWSYSGELVVHFIATFLPTFIIVAIITRGTIRFGMNLVYFLLSVILALVINYNIDFFVGTICIYSESIWGINIMKVVIVQLLSGATIPLAFFPDNIARVVDALPFRAIFDTPLTLLLDSSADPKTAFTKLGISLVWAIVMSCISSLFWRVSIRRITVNGG